MIRSSNARRSPVTAAILSLLAVTASACDPAERGSGGEIDPSGISIGGQDSDDSSLGSSGSGATDAGESDAGSTSGVTGSLGEGGTSCGEQVIVADVAVPQIMLVLDKSRSMVSNRWDADGNPGTPTVTRWHSLHAVVDGLVGGLEQSVQFGAVMFPSATLTSTEAATACGVSDSADVEVGLNHGAAILAAMPAAGSMEIHGGTPTTMGLQVAVTSLLDSADGNPQAIVLVTDGAANCTDGTAGDQVFTVYDNDLTPAVARSVTP